MGSEADKHQGVIALGNGLLVNEVRIYPALILNVKQSPKPLPGYSLTGSI